MIVILRDTTGAKLDSCNYRGSSSWKGGAVHRHSKQQIERLANTYGRYPKNFRLEVCLSRKHTSSRGLTANAFRP